MLIVGLDAASQLKNFGFALGRCKVGKVKTLAAGVLAGGVSELHDCISDHVGMTEPILVAIDAPLGWPAPIGEMLKKHAAGKFIAEKKDALFRRRTENLRGQARIFHKVRGQLAVPATFAPEASPVLVGLHIRPLRAGVFLQCGVLDNTHIGYDNAQYGYSKESHT